MDARERTRRGPGAAAGPGRGGGGSHCMDENRGRPLRQGRLRWTHGPRGDLNEIKLFKPIQNQNKLIQTIFISKRTFPSSKNLK
jgi:hypothetical protein